MNASQLLIRCVCGWSTVGTKAEVVPATQEHGRRIHNMAATHEEVLAMSSPVDLEVVDVPDRHRFEARLGSRVAGFTDYGISDDAITILHTEVYPEHEGKGYGSRLAAAVLANAGSRGLQVVVRCPFIAAYVRRHQADYPDIDLTAGKTRPTRAS